MTRTDHPRFEGSELSVSSNDDLVSAVKVLESDCELIGFLIFRLYRCTRETELF